MSASILLFKNRCHITRVVIGHKCRLILKDECPVNALRAQNLAGGHFLCHEFRLVFVSLSV